MKRKYLYTFDADDIHGKWKYCPRCGSETALIYDGDYSGMLQCLECPDDDDYTSFNISVETEVTE